jgi:RNA polymerase sigma-70 factor (ECF subfamily)
MNAVVQELETQRMDPETADELALAERVANGDERALDVLYERFADPLFAFVYHAMDGARQEAEEVWQDTLSAGVRAFASYRGQSRLFSWLCSIARHKIADHCRRRQTSQNVFPLPPEDLAKLMDSGPLPDEILVRRATCLRVVEVLGLLSPDYRTALVARYADGRNVAEVAQLLGKSYKAAESTLSRAKQAFRVALSAQTEIDL